MRAVDLFAGPGGWDLGAVSLGLRPLGLEYDDAACATRGAAELDTIQVDVSHADPTGYAPRELLIASPPCPTFSTAGDQQGAILFDLLATCARDMVAGNDNRDVARLAAFRLLAPTAKTPERATRDAAMSLLVVEPLRWALALRPRYIALEQVPPVLPLWRFFAALLEQQGYATWVGILNSADFGVPQTRRRAFLIANLAGPARPPTPTHCRGGALTLERELQPWVSMAEALGWGMTARPSVTVASGSSRQGGHDPLDGGSGARATVQRERGSGRWKQRSGQSVNGEGRAEREMDEPSVTIHSRADLIAFVADGEQMPLLHTNRGQDENGDRQTRDGGSWAPTVSGKSGGQWYWGSPATTIAGDPRISSRSHHEHGEQGRDATSSEDARNGDYDGRSAIRITLEEAAIIQGFPADYPWQGTRTKQFEQVGNAVPPPLARAVLEALLA